VKIEIKIQCTSASPLGKRRTANIADTIAGVVTDKGAAMVSDVANVVKSNLAYLQFTVEVPADSEGGAKAATDAIVAALCNELPGFGLRATHVNGAALPARKPNGSGDSTSGGSQTTA
jgi:hypothetical protein